MKKLACLLLGGSLALAMFQAQAATYPGNGNTGFGGPLGTGSITLTDDGTTVNGVFIRGSGNHNDVVVIYIDSTNGGISSTANLTDTGDGHRRAISGFSNPDRTTVNFPGGFAADYGIALYNNDFTFGGLWELAENTSLPFVTSVDLSGGGTAQSSYSFSFDLADIGLTPDSGEPFSFVATYISLSAFRSNEAIGDSDVGGNPGFTGTINFADAATYVTVPEPSTYALLGTGLAGAFFSLRRRR